MDSTTGRSALSRENGAPQQRSSVTDVASTTDSDGLQRRAQVLRQSPSRQGIPSRIDPQSTVPHPSVCDDPGGREERGRGGHGGAKGAAPAASVSRAALTSPAGASGETRSPGCMSKSNAATPAGGRLPRGVSFLCDEDLQERTASSKAGQTSSVGAASAREAFSSAGTDSLGMPLMRRETAKYTDPLPGPPVRTLSGILRTQSSGTTELPPFPKDAADTSPRGRGDLRTPHYSMKSYASLAPELIDGFQNSGRRSTGLSRRRSITVATLTRRKSPHAAVPRRPVFGDWTGGRAIGGFTTPSSGDGSASVRRVDPLFLGEGRPRPRVAGHGRRSSGHISDDSTTILSGGSKRGSLRVFSGGGGGGGGIAGGGGGPLAEFSGSAGLLCRRSRAWAMPQTRQLPAGLKTGAGGGGSGGRMTFRTCSDTDLGPQQQQLPFSRTGGNKLRQDSGTGEGVGGGGPLGGAAAADRIPSGGNFLYYGRSRSTQQYAGRSAGSLWASRYSWLPVFSHQATYGGEDWLEQDGQVRRFWKQRIRDTSHAVATSLAKHVQIGATYGYYPLCSARVLMWICVVCSVYFLAMGLWLIIEDENYLECKLNYESKGPQNGGSRYLLELIRPDMCGSRGGEVTHLPGPVIDVYVEMEHVFQNDAQILWSRSWRQLAGEIITDPAELKECEPYVTAEVENRTKVLHPCGALAWNVLTDQYQFLEGPEDEDEHVASTPIYLNQSQAVVLDAYKGWERLYKNPSKAEREKYRDRVYFWMSPEDNDMRLNPALAKEHARAELTADRLEYKDAGPMVENAHFIQWMTAGAFSRWRKLYGRLTGPLKLPFYAYITSVYDISAWGGKKAVVLVQHSHFGGRTLFLGIMYLVLGCVLLLLSGWLGWKSWHSRVETDAVADLRWQYRKRSLRKNK